MRILSILCGLSFAVTAGYLRGCSVHLMGATAGNDHALLAGVFGPFSWAVLALAAMGGVMGWLSRCEGWTALVTGCAIFLSCHLAMLAGIGAGAVPTALFCLVAAGFALLPLVHMPNSYWRVAG